MKIIITESMNGMTVRDILKNQIQFPASIITFLKSRDNGMVLNGERVTVRKTVKAGDILELEYTDDKTMAEKSEIAPVPLPLDIVYEDDNIIALNKPPFMPTHPSHNHWNDTLANALRYYFDSKDIPFIFRAVNRLDNNTSGIVLVGKNRLATAKLSSDISSGKVFKSYIAVLNGTPDESAGEICAPIKRKEESIITREVSPDGAYSLTKYQTLFSNDMFSLVEAMPITGRTHQLRVHFSHIGHPICGDTLYGYPSRFISRQALHAYKITFTHPINNTPMTLIAKPPQDMALLCRNIFYGLDFDFERLLKI